MIDAILLNELIASLPSIPDGYVGFINRHNATIVYFRTERRAGSESTIEAHRAAEDTWTELKPTPAASEPTKTFAEEITVTDGLAKRVARLERRQNCIVEVIEAKECSQIMFDDGDETPEAATEPKDAK